jgi:hypothetical protein
LDAAASHPTATRDALTAPAASVERGHLPELVPLPTVRLAKEGSRFPVARFAAASTRTATLMAAREPRGSSTHPLFEPRELWLARRFDLPSLPDTWDGRPTQMQAQEAELSSVPTGSADTDTPCAKTAILPKIGHISRVTSWRGPAPECRLPGGDVTSTPG